MAAASDRRGSDLLTFRAKRLPIKTAQSIVLMMLFAAGKWVRYWHVSDVAAQADGFIGLKQTLLLRASTSDFSGHNAKDTAEFSVWSSRLLRSCRQNSNFRGQQLRGVGHWSCAEIHARLPKRTISPA